jgi:hypothetical protein
VGRDHYYCSVCRRKTPGKTGRCPDCKKHLNTGKKRFPDYRPPEAEAEISRRIDYYTRIAAANKPLVPPHLLAQYLWKITTAMWAADDSRARPYEVGPLICMPRRRINGVRAASVASPSGTAAPENYRATSTTAAARTGREAPQGQAELVDAHRGDPARLPPC